MTTDNNPGSEMQRRPTYQERALAAAAMLAVIDRELGHAAFDDVDRRILIDGLLRSLHQRRTFSLRPREAK